MLEFVTDADFLRLWLLFEWISVPMYEFPLPVLTAIDLGQPQIER
jgi:hypothetical protein